MIGPDNCQLIHLITPEILADVGASEPPYERLSLSSPTIDRTDVADNLLGGHTQLYTWAYYRVLTLEWSSLIRGTN